MARTQGPELVCHTHRDLVSYEDHHVWPKQYHGPDTPSNLVRICCNAHSDIHFLLNLMLRQKTYDPREYGAQVRAIAARGYVQIMAYSESLAKSIETRGGEIN